MKVQPSQTTNYNVSYKAKFVFDKNGYLKTLWNNSNRSEILSEEIKRFTNNNPNDVIEIINVNKNHYTMINHKNNTLYGYYMAKGRKYYALYDILDKLNKELSDFNMLLGDNI